MAMEKKNIRKEINEISKISKNIPTLMESIHFNPSSDIHEEDDIDFQDSEEMETPAMPSHEENFAAERPMEGKEIVDKIRKMALRAMADLADNTEDSYYAVLKKIWQMADKNPEDEKNKLKGE